ncbi:menaquinone biosynthetic enzyme MqnA/MqnD family protein [Desulforamulus ferrireducens]|uniref:Chorismate dehydratase n=1 Tax=Desulforamulus ferrireducens TaxID=1833852 RepID=A0A1S6IXT6_9FIRM|nr:menaquinone biosynthesis protein [Desulforamulus ferrireducens]AQS59566.1 hypothetical protein B0537_11035 [Desulforamulus ferrireducens]
MARIRFGQVDNLNTMPVYYAFEEGLVSFEGELIKGAADKLKELFLAGQLEVSTISSIDYPGNINNCLILPNVSVNADGQIHSILLFSHLPVTELDRKVVNVSGFSGSSGALLKVLFDHYYHVEAKLCTMPPNLERMMAQGDGALLVGEEALRAYVQVKQEGLPYQVTDLGEVWKQFTGERMIYDLWVVRKDFAQDNPELVNSLCLAIQEAKQHFPANLPFILEKCRRRTGLSLEILEQYFQTINNDFAEDHRHALLTYYDYCYKSGLIDERVRLSVWGDENI